MNPCLRVRPTFRPAEALPDARGDHGRAAAVTLLVCRRRGRTRLLQLRSASRNDEPRAKPRGLHLAAQDEIGPKSRYEGQGSSRTGLTHPPASDRGGRRIYPEAWPQSDVRARSHLSPFPPKHCKLSHAVNTVRGIPIDVASSDGLYVTVKSAFS